MTLFVAQTTVRECFHGIRQQMTVVSVTARGYEAKAPAAPPPFPAIVTEGIVTAIHNVPDP